MCNSEGCSERAQVLADETDQGRRELAERFAHAEETREAAVGEVAADLAAGRSGSGAARVVPVERLEALADEFEDARTTYAPDSWSRGYNAALGVLTRRLRFVANRDATTVDPKTTRSGFTGADLTASNASEAHPGEGAGERLTEAQGAPDDSAGAESVSAVERAARVLASEQAFYEAQLGRAEGERDRARATAVALEQENAQLHQAPLLTMTTDQATALASDIGASEDSLFVQWVRRGQQVADLEAERERWRSEWQWETDQHQKEAERLTERATIAEALAVRNATTAGVLTADLRRTTRAAGAAEARARRAEDALRRVTRALDDEEANLADDGARLSHAVVRRLRAALSDGGDR